MDTANKLEGFLEGRVSSLKTQEGVGKNGRDYKSWTLILDESFDKKISGFGEPPVELVDASRKEQRVRVAYTMNGHYRNFGGEVEVLASVVPSVEVQKVWSGDKQADLIALLTQARDAFVQVYGKEPKSDGEFAVCNTAFIWLKDGR